MLLRYVSSYGKELKTFNLEYNNWFKCRIHSGLKGILWDISCFFFFFINYNYFSLRSVKVNTAVINSHANLPIRFPKNWTSTLYQATTPSGTETFLCCPPTSVRSPYWKGESNTMTPSLYWSIQAESTRVPANFVSTWLVCGASCLFNSCLDAAVKVFYRCD